MKMKWLNFLNFIRYDDFRTPDLDLFEPVREQMALHRKLAMPATWLMQVDAMLLGPYVEYFKKNKPADHELGVWFEINRAHCEKAGVKYNGRPGANWDSHSNASLSVGYAPEDRLKLADAAMDVFHQAFGYYPATVAAWYIDAVTLDYLNRKYGVTGSANCRDQWGTDGYSLWGGFWHGAYYPSKVNAYIPATSEATQIPVPIFRLLGSCPIDQYASKIGGNGQEVCTLEPVWKDGCQRDWLESFVGNMYGDVPFEYSFAQTGQENSFGWAWMKKGFELQIEYFSQLRARGEIICGTMKEAADWYRKSFHQTVPCAVFAKNDVQGKARKSLWYSSRYYRAGVLIEGDQLKIRDLHLFRADYVDRYQEKTCDDKAMTVDSLPLVEGFLWRKDQEDASAYLEVNRNGHWEKLDWSGLAVSADESQHILTLDSGTGVSLVFTGKSLVVNASTTLCRLVLPKEHVDNPMIQAGGIAYIHRGFYYGITAAGILKSQDDGATIFLESSGGILELGME
ncbi:MAG: hypothetical protein WCS52_13570 [bacterium]